MHEQAQLRLKKDEAVKLGAAVFLVQSLRPGPNARF